MKDHNQIENTAQAIVVSGKGILAADEGKKLITTFLAI